MTIAQCSRDENHLALLGIVYYILSGLWLFGSLGGVLNAILGLCAMKGSFPLPLEHPLPPQVCALGFNPENFGFVLLISGLTGLALSLTIAVVAYFTGRWLRSCRHYKLCLAAGICTLLLFPLGTILGIFTIVVLRRPQVADRFF